MRKRRRYHTRRAGALPPLAIAGICVAAVILLTVLAQSHVIFRTPQKPNTFILKKTWEKNMCELLCGKGIGFVSCGLSN